MKSDLRAGAATALGIVAWFVLDRFTPLLAATFLGVLVGLATWWLTGLVPQRPEPPPPSPGGPSGP